MGFIVQTFERAEDVLDALSRSFHPDLIMSDVNLAGEVHGVTLAHSLKQNSAWTGQVLLMSGLPVQELTESYGLTKDDVILSKPFTINELQRVLRFYP
ncbi:response regulator [Marinomonas aquimarina]|nr:response regulator [Marinomonas aquimarina]